VWTVRNDHGRRFTVVQQNAEHAQDDIGAAARAFIGWDPRHAVLLDDEHASAPSPSPLYSGERAGVKGREGRMLPAD
jgi:hypothetical protein